MPKITIMRGLPGSGKSTRAWELAKAGGNTVRVNRDELRAMMWDHWTGKRESVTIEVEKCVVADALEANFNVVVDDTNLKPKTVDLWRETANLWAAKFEIEDLTNVPLEMCIQRDYGRHLRGERAVGPAIITRMAFENKTFTTYRGPDPSSKPVVVVDLDGTLSDPTHRLRFVKECRNCGWTASVHPHQGISPQDLLDHKICTKFQKDWASFFAQVSHDTPKIGTVLWVRALRDAGYTIVVCSARGSETQWDTWNWLREHQIPFDYLLMRKAGDHRDDTETKRELMGLIGVENVAFAIDDRKKIVELYRSMGLKVYPVNGEGDY